jgi:HK97 family phage prohead protease
MEIKKSAHEIRSYSFEVKMTGEDGEIEGYGSVFDVVDSYDDVIAKGAFGKTLGEHKSKGSMPAMLWQHDASQPVGVWTEMSEDSHGLKVKGKLAMNTAKGKEAYELMKMGAITGLSIGFMSKQWAYDRETEVRTLTEVDLWEVSLVTFPANDKSRVTSVKSVDEILLPKDAENVLRDAGFSKSDATAFVSRVMRMGEARSDSADDASVKDAAERLLRSLKSN